MLRINVGDQHVPSPVWNSKRTLRLHHDVRVTALWRDLFAESPSADPTCIGGVFVLAEPYYRETLIIL